MKQTLKKKPEYLDIIYVEDDSQSIKEIYNLAEVDHGNISFDDDGNRIITIESNSGEIKIPVGDAVFKDKKGGIQHMPKDKILQFYDEYND